jgi:hypothetical protein
MRVFDGSGDVYSIEYRFPSIQTELNADFDGRVQAPTCKMNRLVSSLHPSRWWLPTAPGDFEKPWGIAGTPMLATGVAAWSAVR